ncbi:hypothetical protein BGZ47_009884, partial [Haplosporangium gracile]
PSSRPQKADSDIRSLHHFSDVQRLIFCAATLARFSKQYQRHLSKFRHQTCGPNRTTSTSVDNPWPLTCRHKAFGFKLGIINSGSCANGIDRNIYHDRCGQASPLFLNAIYQQEQSDCSTIASYHGIIDRFYITHVRDKGNKLRRTARVALTAAILDLSFISNVTTGIYQAARNDSQSMAQALHSATDLCSTLQVYA